MAEENTTPENSHKEKISIRNPWLAAILNILAPGLGLVYAGEFKLGITFAFLFPLLKVSFYYISVYLPEKYKLPFIIIFYVVLFLFALIVVIIVASISYRKTIYVLQPYNKTIFYLAFILLYHVYSYSVVAANHQYCFVQTSSMENTLYTGDFVIADMSSYGLCLPLLDKKIINISGPERNDVALYILEEYMGEKYEDKLYSRIVGIPGDTIRIKNKILYVNGSAEKSNPLYRSGDIKRDSSYADPRIYPEFAPWNSDFYGPLYLPKKNDKIKLDSSNILYWQELILRETSPENHNSYNSTPERKAEREFIINNFLKEGSYTVQENYYFLLGDYRDFSFDSRYSGLIKESAIIGKVKYVFCSIDLEKSLFRYERMGKDVK